MRSEPTRQNSMIEYMVTRGPARPYSTRDIAGALNISTGAALAAFKRLRKKGSVFHLSGYWYLTDSERLKHSQALQGSVDRHPSSQKPCPHCGSTDMDRGATGLDRCNNCDGLSRDGQVLALSQESQP